MEEANVSTTSLPTGWQGSAGTLATPEPVGWHNAARYAPTVRIGALQPVPARIAGDGPVARIDRTTSVTAEPVVNTANSAAGPAGDEALVSRETSEPATDASDAPRASASAPPVAETPSSAPLADQLVEQARRRARLTEGRVLPPAQPRIMTISNQKGGVGKTTTTVNVAAALATFGLKVLVIDIDPQGNASTALGIPHHEDVPSVYDVVVEDGTLADVLQECPDIAGLWCAPATIDLAGAELELVSLVARESRLKRAIDRYQGDPGPAGRFDFILIDCPPSLGLLTVNAFVAAEEVFIPIQCEYYALEGLSQLLKNIELIRAHLNPRLHVSTILLTMYDARTRLSAQVAEEVRTHFADQVLKASIPRSVRISEAPSHGQTVLTYDPSSSGALSYSEAAKELAAQDTKIDQ